MATDNLMPQSSASIIKHFMLRSSTTGQGLTGKVAADFSGKYNIAGGAEVTLSFSTGTAGDAYSSGKIVPLGLGKYAWHVPNAVFASLGNVSAVLSVTGAIDVHCEWLVVAAVRDTAAFGANTTSPANSDIAAAKAAAEEIAAMLPNTDFLAGAATAEGYAALDSEGPTAVVIEEAISNDNDGIATQQGIADKVVSTLLNISSTPVEIIDSDVTEFSFGAPKPSPTPYVGHVERR